MEKQRGIFVTVAVLASAVFIGILVIASKSTQFNHAGAFNVGQPGGVVTTHPAPMAFDVNSRNQVEEPEHAITESADASGVNAPPNEEPSSLLSDGPLDLSGVIFPIEHYEKMTLAQLNHEIGILDSLLLSLCTPEHKARYERGQKEYLGPTGVEFEFSGSELQTLTAVISDKSGTYRTQLPENEYPDLYLISATSHQLKALSDIKTQSLLKPELEKLVQRLGGNMPQ